MAFVYQDATLEPGKLELLAAWLPSQPWFPGGSVERVAGAYRFDDPAGEVGLEGQLVRLDDGRVVHAPLSYRAAPLAGAEEFLVGTTEHSALGTRWVYDAVGDPVWAAALATAILTGGTQADIYFEVDGVQQRRESRTKVRGSGAARDAGARTRPTWTWSWCGSSASPTSRSTRPSPPPGPTAGRPSSPGSGARRRARARLLDAEQEGPRQPAHHARRPPPRRRGLVPRQPGAAAGPRRDVLRRAVRAPRGDPAGRPRPLHRLAGGRRRAAHRRGGQRGRRGARARRRARGGRAGPGVAVALEAARLHLRGEPAPRQAAPGPRRRGAARHAGADGRLAPPEAGGDPLPGRPDPGRGVRRGHRPVPLPPRRPRAPRRPAADGGLWRASTARPRPGTT